MDSIEEGAMTSETTTGSGLRLSRVRQIALPVTDLDRAIEFYRDRLGATLQATFNPPGLAFFDFSGVRLMLSLPEGGQRGVPPSVLYFSVAEINEGYRQLQERGISLEGEPHMIFRDDAGAFGEAGLETWMTFFRDSEGNLMGLMAEQRPAS